MLMSILCLFSNYIYCIFNLIRLKLNIERIFKFSYFIFTLIKLVKFIMRLKKDSRDVLDSEAPKKTPYPLCIQLKLI